MTLGSTDKTQLLQHTDTCSMYTRTVHQHLSNIVTTVTA